MASSSSSSLTKHNPYLWIIETLIENNHIPISLIHDMLKKDNSIGNDPWGGVVKEKLALRELEVVLGVMESSNVNVGDMSVEGWSEVAFDVEDSAEVVLKRVNEKMPKSNRSMLLREDLRHFILQKRSSLPKCALQQLEHTIIEGGQLAVPVLRSRSETDRENQDTRTVFFGRDINDSYKRHVNLRNRESKQNRVDCSDTVTGTSAYDGNDVIVSKRPLKLTCEMYRENEEACNATTAIKNPDQGFKDVGFSQLAIAPVNGQSIDGGDNIAISGKAENLIRELNRTAEVNKTISSDNTLVRTERLKKLLGVMDSKDRDDTRMSADGGDVTAISEKPELTKKVPRDDDDSCNAATAVGKPDERVEDVEVDQSILDFSTKAATDGKDYSVCENYSQNVEDSVLVRKRKRSRDTENQQVGCSKVIRSSEDGGDLYPLPSSVDSLYVIKVLKENHGTAKNKATDGETSNLPRDPLEKLIAKDGEGDIHTIVTPKKMKTTRNNDAIQYKESLFPSTDDEIYQKETREVHHQQSHANELQTNLEASRDIDENPVFCSDEDLDIVTEKLNFLNSLNPVDQDSPTSLYCAICVRCNEGDRFLICSVNNCPIAIHKNCVSSSTRFDDAGHFQCPFCSLTLATAIFHKVKKKAATVKKKRALAKKHLLQFMQMVKEHQGKQIPDVVRKEMERHQIIGIEQENVGCHDYDGPHEPREVERDQYNEIEQEEVVGFHDDDESEEPVIPDGNVDKEHASSLEPSVTEDHDDQEPHEPREVEKDQYNEIEQEEVVGYHDDNELEETTISDGDVDKEHASSLEPSIAEDCDDQEPHEPCKSHSGNDLSQEKKKNLTSIKEINVSLLRKKIKAKMAVELQPLEPSNSHNDRIISQEEEDRNMRRNRTSNVSFSRKRGKAKMDEELQPPESSSSHNDDDLIQEEKQKTMMNKKTSNVSFSRTRGKTKMDEEQTGVDGSNIDVLLRQHTYLGKKIAQSQRQNVYQPHETSSGENSDEEKNSESKDDATFEFKKRQRKRIKHVSKPSFSGSKRKRIRWTTEEVKTLKDGVRVFATSEDKNIPWKRILEYGCDVFHETRTAIDLKDKFRKIRD